MDLRICTPRGFLPPEIHGLAKLKQSLDDSWLAYANIHIPVGNGFAEEAEIDVALFGPGGIWIVDLKNWKGKIVSKNNRWIVVRGDFQEPRDFSPARKIKSHAPRFAAFLQSGLGREPWVNACCVFTHPAADISELQEQNVYYIDEFISHLRAEARNPNPRPWRDKKRPIRDFRLYAATLEPIFRGSDALVQGRKGLFGSFIAEKDAVGRHPSNFYRLHRAFHYRAPSRQALLKRWDLIKWAEAHPERAAEAQVATFLSRELNALRFLDEHVPDEADRPHLRLVDDAGEVALDHWLVVGDERGLESLSDYLNRRGEVLKPNQRVEIALQLVRRVKTIHEAGLCHRNLRERDVWIYGGGFVALANFEGATFPDIKTVEFMERSELLGAGFEYPEYTTPGSERNGFKEDVYALGVLTTMILVGKVERDVATKLPLPPSPDILRQKGLPADIAIVLADALSSDLAARPRNAVDLLDRLTQILGVSEASAAQRELAAYRNDKAVMAVYQPTGPMSFDEMGRGRYSSLHNGRPAIVKTWPAGNHLASAPADLLQFLDRLQRARRIGPPYFPVIIDVGVDVTQSAYLVYEPVNGSTWAEIDWQQEPPRTAIKAALALLTVVQFLHEKSFVHGDLKPENLVVAKSGDEVRLTVIDLAELAWSGSSFGNTANSPPGREDPSALERDLYAVLKMAREVTCAAGLSILQDPASLGDVSGRGLGDAALRAIEALERSLAPAVSADEPTVVPVLHVFVRDALTPTTLIGDNDFLAVSVRLYNGPAGRYQIRVTGLNAALELLVGADAVLTGGRIRELVFADAVRKLAKARKHGRVIRARIVCSSRGNQPESELGPLIWPILLPPEKSAKATRSTVAFDHIASDEDVADPVDVEPEESSLPPELESLTAPVPTPAPSAQLPALENPSRVNQVPVSSLWPAIIRVESEVQPEIRLLQVPRVTSGAAYVVLRYASEEDLTFDSDVSLCLLLEESNRTTELGEIDAQRSDRQVLHVRFRRRALAALQRLRPGARLKVVERRQGESLRRRFRAVTRIVRNEAHIRHLADYFCAVRPSQIDSSQFEIDESAIDSYGLTEEQAEALRKLWSAGPVSFLQGPPGTGKTTWLSAVAHYALTAGRMEKVLIAAQSHNAVDNAVVATIKRLRATGHEVDLLRVGQASDISEDVAEFHCDSIRLSISENHAAYRRENVRWLGKRFGLPQAFVDETLDHLPIIDIARQRDDLVHDEGAEEGREGRLQAFSRRLSDYGISAAVPSATAALKAMLSTRHELCGMENVERFWAAIDLYDEHQAMLRAGRGGLQQLLARSRRLVCGTCVGLGQRALRLDSIPFDLVIIDEAGRANPGELAVPLQVARKAILVGDHQQLPPTYERAIEQGLQRYLPPTMPVDVLEKSDFERAFVKPANAPAVSTLTRQYRMTEPINDLVSTIFYDGSLRTAEDRKLPPDFLASLPNPFSVPVGWVDTGPGSIEMSGKRIPTSFANEAELYAILESLKQLSLRPSTISSMRAFSEATGEAPVGVIAMYREQALLIEERLWEQPWAQSLDGLVRLGTVDAYQGKEHLIVLLSLVRSNSSKSTGHATSGKRVNVALSRARDRLLIFGSRSFWSSIPDSPMAAVIKMMARGNPDHYATWDPKSMVRLRTEAVI